MTSNLLRIDPTTLYPIPSKRFVVEIPNQFNIVNDGVMYLKKIIIPLPFIQNLPFLRKGCHI